MDYSTPSFPVLHYLPEFVQSHAHWVGDAVQLSHPLPPSSPPAFRLTLLNQSPRRVPLPDVSVVWANRTRLRSVQKQRLSSLIRGWSGLSLPSAAHLCPTLPALPGRPWAGLLLLDLTSGVEFMWGQHGSAAPASDPGAGRRVSAHGLPRLCTRPAPSLHTACSSHLELPRHLQCFCTCAPSYHVGCSRFAPGALVWTTRAKASAHGPAGASGTTKHKGKKRRLGFILLLRVYFYFPEIANGLCWWQIPAPPHVPPVFYLSLILEAHRSFCSSFLMVWGWLSSWPQGKKRSFSPAAFRCLSPDLSPDCIPERPPFGDRGHWVI